MKTLVASLVLLVASFTTPAAADPVDAAFDAEIGLSTIVVPTVVETPRAPRRDPATVGRLADRRHVDLAAQDDDAGHRFEVTRPASRRHRHHGHVASR